MRLPTTFEALVQEALDQYDNLLESQNQGIVQQLTNGVGILTRAELEELLSPYRNSDATTTAVAISKRVSCQITTFFSCAAAGCGS